MRDRKETGERVRGETGQNIGEDVLEQETVAQKRCNSHKKAIRKPTIF